MTPPEVELNRRGAGLHSAFFVLASKTSLAPDLKLPHDVIFIACKPLQRTVLKKEGNVGQFYRVFPFVMVARTLRSS